MVNFAAKSGSDYATIAPLVEPTGDDLGRTLVRMAEVLEGAFQFDSSFIAAFTVLSGGSKSQWALRFEKDGCEFSEQSIDTPDFEVIIREPAWWDIASGRLSPMEAFGQGKMRIRGDLSFGKQLYAKLARDDGTVAVCGDSYGS